MSWLNYTPSKRTRGTEVVRTLIMRQIQVHRGLRIFLLPLPSSKIQRKNMSLARPNHTPLFHLTNRCYIGSNSLQ